MTKLLTPSHIANFFLSKKDHDIDNLKLNKLVYISLGWAFPILKRNLQSPLFIESVEAWQYGPVIPSIYHQFKQFRYKIITSKPFIYDYVKKENLNLRIVDSKIKNFLDEVWGVYGSVSSSDLVDLTHQKGTPWEQSYRSDKLYVIIPTERIKKYYDGLSQRKTK